MHSQTTQTITLSHEETVQALLKGLQVLHKGKASVIPKDADASQIQVRFAEDLSGPGTPEDTTGGTLLHCTITLPAVTQQINANEGPSA